MADETKPIDEIPIEFLGLSTRAHNALKRLGVHTVAQLTVLSAKELLARSGFGDNAIDNIRRALARYGLFLRDDEVSMPPEDYVQSVSSRVASISCHLARLSEEIELCREHVRSQLEAAASQLSEMSAKLKALADTMSRVASNRS